MANVRANCIQIEYDTFGERSAGVPDMAKLMAQMAAVATHGSRKERLAQLDVPALVIHGKADPLVPVEGGIDTHEALRGSRLLVIDGVGHDLPCQAWLRVVDAITELTGGC